VNHKNPLFRVSYSSESLSLCHTEGSVLRDSESLSLRGEGVRKGLVGSRCVQLLASGVGRGLNLPDLVFSGGFFEFISSESVSRSSETVKEGDLGLSKVGVGLWLGGEGVAEQDYDDDDDVQIISTKDFKPSSQSLSLLRQSLPSVNSARAKAIRSDSQRKIADRTKGGFGIRPANDTAIRKTVFIWLIKGAPIRPSQLGVSIVKRLDPSTRIDTPEAVDSFVRSFIPTFPVINEHKDIRSGTLHISIDRLAYIGKVDGSLCSFFPVYVFLSTESTERR